MIEPKVLTAPRPVDVLDVPSVKEGAALRTDVLVRLLANHRTSKRSRASAMQKFLRTSFAKEKTSMADSKASLEPDGDSLPAVA